MGEHEELHRTTKETNTSSRAPRWQVCISVSRRRRPLARSRSSASCIELSRQGGRNQAAQLDRVPSTNSAQSLLMKVAQVLSWKECGRWKEERREDDGSYGNFWTRSVVPALSRRFAFFSRYDTAFFSKRRHNPVQPIKLSASASPTPSCILL